MWISRGSEKNLVEAINTLNNQVVILRGARQVGKTTFIERCLESFDPQLIIRVNLLHATMSDVAGRRYYGRDFLGPQMTATNFSLISAVSPTVNP